MLHGGWPFVREAGALLQKPNVYLDLSQETLTFPPPHPRPPGSASGSKPSPTKSSSAPTATPTTTPWAGKSPPGSPPATGRAALGLALTGMLHDGEITPTTRPADRRQGPSHQRRHPLQHPLGVQPSKHLRHIQIDRRPQNLQPIPTQSFHPPTRISRRRPIRRIKNPDVLHPHRHKVIQPPHHPPRPILRRKVSRSPAAEPSPSPRSFFAPCQTTQTSGSLTLLFESPRPILRQHIDLPLHAIG